MRYRMLALLMMVISICRFQSMAARGEAMKELRTHTTNDWGLMLVIFLNIKLELANHA